MTPSPNKIGRGAGIYEIRVNVPVALRRRQTKIGMSSMVHEISTNLGMTPRTSANPGVGRRLPVPVPGTSDRDRKRMARLILEDVTLTRDHMLITAQVRFKGGATRVLSLPTPPTA
jgi:hypothetical protein